MFSHIFKGVFLTPFGSHPPNFSVNILFFELSTQIASYILLYLKILYITIAQDAKEFKKCCPHAMTAMEALLEAEETS